MINRILRRNHLYKRCITAITRIQRSYATESNFKALPFTHDTAEAQQVITQWTRKNKLSPVAFHSVTGNIEKYYVPFWLFDCDSTIVFQGRMGVPQMYRQGRQTITRVVWENSPPLQLQHHVGNVACYASTVFEKSLVEKIAQQQEMFDSTSYRQLSYNSNEYKVDVYTIDRDSAWDLTRYRLIDKQLEQLCIRALRQQFPGYTHYEVQYIEYHYNSLRADLVYYPVFVMSYPFVNVLFTAEELRAFADGRNLKPENVYGYRHYGFLRTFGTSLVATCAAIPFIADTTHHTLTEYYPYCALFSIGVGLFAMYSPILRKMWDNFDRQQVLSFISTAQYRKQQEQARQRDFEDFYGWQQGWYQQQQQAGSRQQQQTYRRQYQQQQQQQQTYQRSPGGGFEQEVREKKDFYTMLDLDPKRKDTYSTEEIKKAYRKAAMKYHPDMHPAADKKKMEEKFKEVNQAYMVLQDESSRKKYNMYGRGV
jgi:hypothetical protein